MIALVMVASLAAGILFIRSYMMQQTFRERSSQLEEMLSQIRVNLDYGMDTHWNLVTSVYETVDGKHYDNIEQLMQAIDEADKHFRTDLYSCRIMLLNTTGKAYLSDGAVGIWDDIGYIADGEARHTFVSDTSNVDGTFLVFAQKLTNPITVGAEGERFTHLIMLKDIESLRKYYTTETYGGKAATYIIKSNGTVAYYDANDDDIIGARNIFKVLDSVEYVNDRSFDEIKELLA